jgi:hypothetical protein
MEDFAIWESKSKVRTLFMPNRRGPFSFYTLLALVNQNRNREPGTFTFLNEASWPNYV